MAVDMNKLVNLDRLKEFQTSENASTASEFSTSKSYAAGAYVYYKGKLYKFKSAHAAGAWTTTDVEEAKLADDVSSLKESINENVNDLKTAITQEISRATTAENTKINKPVTNPDGTNGQVLRTNGDGTTAWANVGTPTDEQTAEAVTAWLNTHPEATTTVDFDVVYKVLDTVSEMVNDLTLVSGNNVKTNGYHTVYDGGGAYYKISETADRACSIQLANNLYAVLIGNAHNTRQLGIVANDKAQDKINVYIADTSFIALTVLDPIVLKKSASGQAVDVTELIKIRRDNFTLAFESDGKFTLETLGEDYYRMIAIAANNITVINPVLIGDADTIGITTGEYGHGLYIRTGENITVYNGNISKCFGDAVGINKGTANIIFIGTLYCSYCGRQGVSVVGCDGLYIDTIVGKYIQRTSPCAVIDFEPNDAESPINAYIKQVVAIDCKRGFLVAGNSTESIFVDNVYTKHSSNDYWSDFEVNGTTLFSANPVVQVVCNNVVVENAFKTVASFSNLNSKASVKCGNIIVNGMNKAGTNSTAEATVYFNKGAKNVDLNIKVRNNTSANPNLGVFCRIANETFENVHIVTEDDCSQVVTDSLNEATLINSTVISKPQSNNIQYINASAITIERTDNTNYQVRSFGNYILVLNLKATQFSLYRSYLSDYSIVDPDNIVTETSSYWSISNTVKIAAFAFDNTSKKVTVRKFA